MNVRALPHHPLRTPPIWDVARGVLGALPETPELAGHLPGLRDVAARVLVAAGGADLVFVGRSPEPLHFYLSGALHSIPGAPALALCNVSLRAGHYAPAHALTLRRVLAGAGADPGTLVQDDRRIALVDVVASGGTFAVLAGELRAWAEEVGVGRRSAQRRVRFVGVTHPYSGAWRAQEAVQPFRCRSVRVPYEVWDLLGNSDVKVATWHPPERWLDEWRCVPERTPARAQALADARALLDLGRCPDERRAFVRALNAAGAQRSSALRRVAMGLRGRAHRA